MTIIILASSSTARRRMLEHAGVRVRCEPAAIDESAKKREILAGGGSSEEVAAALAKEKARCVAKRFSDVMVVGADQVLVCENKLFEKPNTPDEARSQLIALRGRAHTLFSAVAVMRNDTVLWKKTETAQLVMRNFSDEFLDSYLRNTGANILYSLGGYHVEGDGIQLFSEIIGDHFVIMGLPLLSLAEFLRGQGILAS